MTPWSQDPQCPDQRYTGRNSWYWNLERWQKQQCQREGKFAQSSWNRSKRYVLTLPLVAKRYKAQDRTYEWRIVWDFKARGYDCDERCLINSCAMPGCCGLDEIEERNVQKTSRIYAGRGGPRPRCACVEIGDWRFDVWLQERHSCACATNTFLPQQYSMLI